MLVDRVYWLEVLLWIITGEIPNGDFKDVLILAVELPAYQSYSKPQEDLYWSYRHLQDRTFS